MEFSFVYFLKMKFCVGCIKGFEIVDLEIFDMQGLFDLLDGLLDFVLKRDNVRLIVIYRIEEDFLLCYDGEFIWQFQICDKMLMEVEFVFYVNKNGWWLRFKWVIVWEGIFIFFGKVLLCLIIVEIDELMKNSIVIFICYCV